MFGFYNKILMIDATQGTSIPEQIQDDVLSRSLGGKGLGAHLLLRHNPPGVDPLAPENHLIFATGPVVGTPIWGSCRYGIYSKSPQTGYFMESYSGGTAGEYMAKTGYDAMILHGQAEAPVWVEIGEEGAVFHPAEDLWGKDTYETEDRIRAWIAKNRPEAKRCGVLTIGPAGENKVACAVIENDYWRSAGRTGAGAVMGSKRIKAVAFWGNQTREPAHPDLVKDLVKTFAKKAKTDKGVQAYKNMGTPMLVDVISGVGSFPTRYWHRGEAAHREQINAAALHERMDVTPHSCLRCFIACGRMATVKEGRHKGLKIEGPEYETIYAFGGLCEVDNIEDIAYLNDLCDRLGLDTISAGNLVGLTVEAVRSGRVDYDIDYGRTESIARLLEDMAYRRGIGESLAKGIKSVAKEWSMEDEAIHVKGLEPAGYDPRVLKGMSLAYGTSDRGACHLRATFYKPELAGISDPEVIEGKAVEFIEWEDRLTLFDALILCRFYRDLYQWEDLAAIIKATVGLDLDKKQLQAIAVQIKDDCRRFNLQEGLTPQEDRLPKRFFKEPLPETGKLITEDQMEQLLSDYYRARGWDEKGRPPSPGI